MSVSCLCHTALLWKVNSTQSWSFDHFELTHSQFIENIYCCSCFKMYCLFLRYFIMFFFNSWSFFKCFSLPFFGIIKFLLLHLSISHVLHIVIVFLIFILKSLVKILRKIRWIFKESRKNPFYALSHQCLFPFTWGIFFIPYTGFFLILILFSLTGGFPMRHSIKCFNKVRIDEIYWIPFIQKYPI